MSQQWKLLKGGTVLTHDADDHVVAVQADVLIEDNRISKIEKGIVPPCAAEVIDCVDKILSPGFIDTHHHVWQTLLKGRHADQLLLDYMPCGNFPSSIHDPAEIFWGQLGGCLECLDVGTTTVVDFAHLNYSPEHSKAAIAATISSGLRSVFCYSPTPRLASWKPFGFAKDLLPDWVMNTFDSLVAKSPFGDGRVDLGFAFDGFFLPKDFVVALLHKVKAQGVKLITSHYARNAIQGNHSLVELLESYGHLDSSILFAHFNNATQNDAKLVLESSSHVCSTPSTEMQMAMGHSVAFDPDLKIQSQASLGIDCHSNNSASIISEMRLLLQSSRNIHNQKYVNVGKVPKKVNKTVEEAFNLGTISGARAINMHDKIGSLAVGKLADIVVYDKLSPSMICAAEHNPVAAIVLHSSPADIEMVIVNGIVRKSDSMLKSVDLSAGKEIWTDVNGAGVAQWKDIARKLVERRKVMQAKVEKLDMEGAKRGMIQAFYIDESKIVDKW